MNGVLEGIAEIEPPMPPVEGPWGELSVLLVLLIAVVAVIYVLWRGQRSHRARARRKLSTLRKLQSPNDSHEIAFDVADTLRQGLGLQQLSYLTPLPESLLPQSRHWHDFIRRLSRARYSPVQLDRNELRRLINDANEWLSRWP